MRLQDVTVAVFVVRKSQWSGAKALAKLIKPRKEGTSRERDAKEVDRTKCAPDIPLPSPPPLFPPETPPPVPQRTVSDVQDGGHGNHIGPHSPALTPISRGEDSSNPTSLFSPAEGSSWSRSRSHRLYSYAQTLGGALTSAFSGPSSFLCWGSFSMIGTNLPFSRV